MLTESVQDKAAFKFIMLAGGPGSGKSYIANKLFGFDPHVSFSGSGLKRVNLDPIFELMLKKNGYSPDLSGLSDKEFDALTTQTNPNSLREKSRRLMKRQLDLYASQGLGMVYDSLGRFAHDYQLLKEDMEDAGYDTYMLWVETPLEVALERNARRPRKLPAELVARLHKEVQHNKQKYQSIFGDKMIVVQNPTNAKISPEIQSQIDKIIAAPVKNPKGRYRLRHNLSKPRELPVLHITRRPPEILNPKKTSQKFKNTELNGDLPGFFDDDYPFDYDNGSHNQTPSDPFSYQDAWNSPKWWDQPKRTQPKPLIQSVPDKFLTPQGTTIQSLDKPDDNIMNRRIRNPQTGNDILVRTAMGYPPNHPMRITAEKLVRGEQNP